jgi:hypothetical protein
MIGRCATFPRRVSCTDASLVPGDIGGEAPHAHHMIAVLGIPANRSPRRLACCSRLQLPWGPMGSLSPNLPWTEPSSTLACIHLRLAASTPRSTRLSTSRSDGGSTGSIIT